MTKILLNTACVLMLAAALTGCAAESAEVPTDPAPAETVQTELVTFVRRVVTEDSIRELEELSDLKQADLTGSTCTRAVIEYALSHPEVAVTFPVELGGTQAAWDTDALTLQPGDYQMDILLEALPNLPKLERIHFPETDFTASQLEQLHSSAPELTVTYTVKLAGQLLNQDAAEADLSNLNPQELEQAIAALPLLPQITDIQLMDPEGKTPFSLEDAAALQLAAPDALLHYSFVLFGKTISTTDEEIYYVNKYIGNRVEGAAEQLHQALSLMKGCGRFILDNCHFDNELLAGFREEFRDTTHLVWRVWFGDEGSCLTDREVIRHVYGLQDSNCSDLQYCEDARFIDIGHNEYLTTVDFAAHMPRLEAIIVSGAPIRDLSPFAQCSKLEFLELAYCGYVEDLSPIAQCGNLKRLNIAYTAVSDLAPLDDLELEVMVDLHSRTTEEEQLRFEELHGGCMVQHDGTQPYGIPWRYGLDGKANDYYAMLRKVFDYDHARNTYA